MIPFAELAAQGCPPHGELALSLAAELGDADVEGARTALHGLADGLAVVRSAAAREQLAHCGRAVASRLAARVRLADVDDLLLDRALRQAVADPVCWAVACVEVAALAGISLDVVADPEDHVLVAHRDLGTSVVLEPRAPLALLEAGDLPAGGEVSRRGSHQTALMLLDRVVARASRSGRHGLALRAARLRLDLPLDEPTLERLRAEAAQLGTRMN